MPHTLIAPIAASALADAHALLYPILILTVTRRRQPTSTVRPDPLAGMTRRDRLAYEAQCARYLANHPGWYSEVFDVGVVVAARYDLDHPLRPENSVFLDCLDCGANLQYHVATTLPVLCLACACHRACEDDPDCECIYRGD